MGQVPAILRSGTAGMAIRLGKESDTFAADPEGGFIQVYVTDAEYLAGEGESYLEEVYIHEGVHVALDPDQVYEREWCAAALADGGYISDRRGNIKHPVGRARSPSWLSAVAIPLPDSGLGPTGSERDARRFDLGSARPFSVVPVTGTARRRD